MKPLSTSVPSLFLVWIHSEEGSAERCTDAASSQATNVESSLQETMCGRVVMSVESAVKSIPLEPSSPAGSVATWAPGVQSTKLPSTRMGRLAALAGHSHWIHRRSDHRPPGHVDVPVADIVVGRLFDVCVPLFHHHAQAHEN